jgi:putative membrane protein
MNRSALALCIAALAAAPLFPASAEVGLKIEATAPKLDVQTQNFVKSARISGAFEVESSKLALQKTQNADIKAFAERMVTDHTKAAEELGQITANKSIRIEEPATADKLDKKHEELLEKLRKASAAEFDKLYVKMQQTAHDDAVKLFTQYSQKGTNPALKTYAEETLPTLQDHKKMISGMNVS